MPTTDCLFITSSKARAVQFSVYPYLGVGVLSSFMKMRGMHSQLYDVDVRGSNLRRIIREIAALQLRMVGYSVMSISLPFFYRLTAEIRKHFPGIPIVAGGPHITNDPRAVADMGIDYGFRGQCELSFPEFADRLRQGRSDVDDIDGIVIPEKKIIREPASFDIRNSPVLPDLNLYSIDRYQNVFYGRKWFTMITTAGCAYNCKFCKDPGKNRYAEYPLEAVFRQLDLLVGTHGRRWISFVDDSFTYKRERVIAICNYILEKGYRFRWTCCTRADVVDEELTGIMKKAGLEFVILGVEAGNEEVRKNINKNISTARYEEVIAMFRRAGVRCLCSYVLGNPGETYAQVRETIRLSRKLRANYAQYYNMNALPASPIFSSGLSEGKLGEDAWSRYMRGEADLPYYVPQWMEIGRLKRLRFGAFLGYYLRPLQLFDMGLRILRLFLDLAFSRG